MERGQLSLAIARPWIVAFAFGLLHGFGFAGALVELGLPQGDIPLALLAFNIGVELGQLAFIAVLLTAVHAVRRFATIPRAGDRRLGLRHRHRRGILERRTAGRDVPVRRDTMMRSLQTSETSSLLAVDSGGGPDRSSALAHKDFACGYDDPQSLSRGSLNWSYPNSLYVIGAISREVAARRLPTSQFRPPRRWTCSDTSSSWPRPRWSSSARCSVRRPPSRCRSPVAVVLVEPMLWARFEPTDRRLANDRPRLGRRARRSGRDHWRGGYRRDRRAASHLRRRHMRAAQRASTAMMPRSLRLLGIAGQVGASHAHVDSEARAAPASRQPRRRGDSFVCTPRSTGAAAFEASNKLIRMMESSMIRSIPHDGGFALLTRVPRHIRSGAGSGVDH